MSDVGTALPGYTAEDLLRIIDINHLQVSNDQVTVVRRGGTTLSQPDIERAALAFAEPQVKALIGDPGPNVVVIDGNFDQSQMGRIISPLSYVVAMFSQAVRQQTVQQTASSPRTENGTAQPRAVILEYYCELHTEKDDKLRGPQGLVSCITTQLILSLVANECLGEKEAVNLPHLRDQEEAYLADKRLDAVCRLFAALLHHVPPGVPVYCLIDGWSVYEREKSWQRDYDLVLDTFGRALGGGSDFKLLFTSPTACRDLGDFVRPNQRVSLRERFAGTGNWRGAGRGGLMGLARAATLPSAHRGFAPVYPRNGYEDSWNGDGHDQRSPAG